MKKESWKKGTIHGIWAIAVIVMVGWATGSKADTISYDKYGSGYRDLNEVANTSASGKLMVYVFNSKNNVVRAFCQAPNRGVLKIIKFELQKSLHNGIYTLVVEQDGTKQFKKMVVKNQNKL
jgi:hypothetical protein